MQKTYIGTRYIEHSIQGTGWKANSNSQKENYGKEFSKKDAENEKHLKATRTNTFSIKKAAQW